MSRFTVDEARRLLMAAKVFFYEDVETETRNINSYEGDYWTPEHKQQLIDEISRTQQELNMNDVWGWGEAWGQKVEDNELATVAELFADYGWCGILYWVSEKHNHMNYEFKDVNRMIEFVRQEEKVKKDIPESSRRAYAKITYQLGG